jgi:hypothetical protein
MIMTRFRSAASDEATSYCELVGKALGADRFTLDVFPVLSRLPAVEQWAAAHPHALLARGKALQALLRRAVADVATGYADTDDVALRQLAVYVRLRYQEQQSVAAIAQQWLLNRSYVSRRWSHRAVQVIAHRFAQLVQGVHWSADDITTTQTS